MNNGSEKHGPSPGRAKAVFAVGDGEGARAVISTVTARLTAGDHTERLRFCGPSQPDQHTIRHLRKVVLPQVDRIMERLGLSPGSYEVSITNIGAASASDIGLAITGFSADVPVFLALLSSALRMPVPGDVVCTGHIASGDGDIALVKNLPAKLAAASTAPRVETMFYPSLEEDSSLSELSPRERERAEAAVAEARSHIRAVPIAHTADLVNKVFPDRAVVLAALKKRFYERALPIDADGAGRTAEVLMEDLEERFWTVLETRLHRGESEAAGELLSARIDYHVRRESYPEGFGGKLLALLRSLPPATRRLKLDFPLVHTEACIRISQCAGQANHEDVKLLFEAASAKEERVGRGPARVADEDGPSAEDSAAAAVEAVLSEINERALAEKIGMPIDEARSTFTGAKVRVKSEPEFHQTIEAFYAHLLRHTEDIVGPINREYASRKAKAWLDRAFSRRGGYQAAVAEALEPTRGGMRYVLDILTDRMKMEAQENHVDAVLREALDLRDRKAQKEFMRIFRERLRPQLPSEIQTLSLDNLAANYQQVVRAYVRSRDQFEKVLRRL